LAALKAKVAAAKANLLRSSA